MFRWLAMFKNPRREFEDGSQIKPIDRDAYEYSELNGHVMTIEATLMGIGPIDRELKLDDFVRWCAPNDAEVVSEDKQREIIGKFMRYFDERRVTYKFG